MKLPKLILLTSLICGIICTFPVIRADAQNTFGEPTGISVQLQDIDRRVGSIEKLADVVSEMKTDLAVQKSEMSEVMWLLRGIFLLVTGVIVERVSQLSKTRKSGVVDSKGASV